MARKHASAVGLAWVAAVSFSSCYALLLATAPRQPSSLAALTCSGIYFEDGKPAPSPNLTPGQVVQLTVDALRTNDTSNHGIAVTFAFTSPGNLSFNGPLDEFSALLNNEIYAPLLNHVMAEVGEVRLDQDVAHSVVTIVDANGDDATYLFQLSKQNGGEFVDCWMTDGVTRLDRPKTPTPSQPAAENTFASQL